MNEKAQLRAEVRARLSSLQARERSALGDRIANHVWSLPEVIGARNVLVYASLPAEVPTEGIVAEARARGIGVAYPRCLPEGRQMTLHAVQTDDELRAGGAYGIWEPAAHCATLDIEAIDVAFLPGLAWDRTGHRLGRGAGYYDRLLGDRRWRAFRCGLFFAIQEVAAIPSDAWDAAMDAVVTERETLRVILNS